MDTQVLFRFRYGSQILALNRIIKNWWLAFASELPWSKFIFFILLRYGSNTTSSNRVRVGGTWLSIEVWLKRLDIFRSILFIASRTIHAFSLFYVAILTLIYNAIWTVLLWIPCRIILLYLVALYFDMRLTSRLLELLVILLIYWLCNILLWLMLTWIRFVSCIIHDSTISEILDISSALLAVMAIFLSDRVLRPLRNEIVCWMLFLHGSVMRVCIWRGLRLNRTRHLLTELTAIRILRQLILVSLLIILWTELRRLIPTTLYLLLVLSVLAINWPCWGSIFRIRSIFWGTLCGLHWIVASTISFHELLPISVLSNWLQLAKSFWWMHSMGVGTI